MSTTEPEFAPHRALSHVGNTPIRTFLLAVVTVGSAAVFLVAVYWNLLIGETASDTGGNGGNNAAWLLLFSFFAIGLASLVALIVVSGRARRFRQSQITRP